MAYSIGQVAKKTGLTAHTLRYYEKEGLLPFIKKNSSGLRSFSDEDLNWLSIIECLKGTGMALKDIKQYIDWSIEGDSTLPQRLEMFRRQKEKTKAQIALFKKYLTRIEYKIDMYDEAVRLGSLEAVISARKTAK